MSLSTVEEARSRASIYGLLAALFRREMTAEALEALRSCGMLQQWRREGYDLSPDCFEAPAAELAEVLRAEYARLFIGPGPHIPPYESVHHPREKHRRLLWGETTVEVKKFVEHYGLSYPDDYRDMPDHIAVELEFMQSLVEKEAEAAEKGDEELRRHAVKVEEVFLREHPAAWIPAFCDQVVRRAEHSFYRALAHVAKDFILGEQKEIKASPTPSA